MSWEEELCRRLQRVLPLSKKCVKYVKAPERAEDELLTHKVLLSLAKRVHEKRGPVKLRDIVEDLYGSVTKRDMDIVRLLIGKTLIPCGVVEKLYVGKRRVRYLLSAYRFQEVREVYSSSGQILKEPVGPIIEIPREHFPIPSEAFQLLLSKKGLVRVLSKLDEDFRCRKISETLYKKMKAEYEGFRENAHKKLKEYEELLKLLNLDY
ncbi:MAG: hypothetical protein ACE5OW_07100 [Candidatus Bathyarchaeia archaeon]